MNCDEETIRKLAREVFQEEFKKMGIDVAKYGGSAGIGALLALVLTNKDKISELLSRGGGKGEVSQDEFQRLLKEIESSAPSTSPSPEPSSELAKIVRRRHEIEELLRNLRDRLAKGEITKEDYESLKQDYEKELSELEQRERLLVGR